MKKLILLLLTLGLTFPGAHLLAGGSWSSFTRQEQENNAEATLPTIPLDVVTKEILSRIVDEALKKFDWKTISNIARTSKAYAEFVKNHIGITAQDRKRIEQYRCWLNNIESPSFLIDHFWKGYKRSPLSFNPPWLLSSVDAHASYEERVKQIKQLMFCSFILNENVGLNTARIIINLFLKHGVDLNIKYGSRTCVLKTGEQFKTLDLVKGSYPQLTILELIQKENAPFTQSLAMTEQEDYCPAIIQALKEAIPKQFIPKIPDLQIDELLDAFGYYTQNFEGREGEHVKQLIIEELANRDFEPPFIFFKSRIPHLQESHLLDEILAYVKMLKNQKRTLKH